MCVFARSRMTPGFVLAAVLGLFQASLGACPAVAAETSCRSPVLLPPPPPPPPPPPQPFWELISTVAPPADEEVTSEYHGLLLIVIAPATFLLLMITFSLSYKVMKRCQTVFT